MTYEEAEAIQTRLAGIVFSLTWHDQQGALCHGTGFFIGSDGTALTAFHNLSPELLNDPEAVQIGRFGDAEVEFRWVVQSDEDRAWQRRHDTAILRAASPPLPALKPVRCFFLSSKVRERRGNVWAEDDIAFLGHPAWAGFARNLITGRVDRIRPIRDHGRIEGAIQIGADFSGDLAGLRGMSGSPVYDVKYGGVVGIVAGIEKQVSAGELWPVAEYWPPGKELLKSVPVAAPAARLKPWLLAIPLIAAAGGWWYLHAPRAIPKQLAVDVLRLDANRHETLTEGTAFREGERVRFLITPPAAGFLYVVDQELNRKGEPGPPELIFPTATTGMGRNRVSAGVPIPFPAEDESPPYLEPKPAEGSQDYSGEELTVLVYTNPLNIELKSDPIQLSPGQIPLDGLRPRTFIHPTASSADALAVQRIRVQVRRGRQ